MSGLGKGITTSAIGLLLKSAGFKASLIKCDPYLNVDAGTMNPIVHGETFVTGDGLETDQDLGHYERFLNEDLTKYNYMTSGQVFLSVIKKERNLDYGGECVEFIPHVPREIIRRLKKLASLQKADFVVVEIGGTVGEYQNLIFLEAIRQLKIEEGKNVLNIHVSYLPCPPHLGELKTKPVQTGVHFLHEAGLSADIIIGRAEKTLDSLRIKKIATFCNVKKKDIFSNPDVDSVYKVPLVLEEQGLGEKIIEKFGLKKREVNLKRWQMFVDKIDRAKEKVKIAIVGKYFRSGNFSLKDSYICVWEALKHACYNLGKKPEITWIDSLDIEKKGVEMLGFYQGIVVPQGWGTRGVEGKIMAAGYARKKKIPYLGLCYGMQMACIEFGRNVCKLKGANSKEIDRKTKHPVITIMAGQEKYLKKRQYGGTIRLGYWPCKVFKKSKLGSYYSRYKGLPSGNVVMERHRHRYEFNKKYKKMFEEKGMVFSGMSPDKKLVEAIELLDHPFFVGTQFHPEFVSRPLAPHPVFLGFVESCLKN